MKNLALIIFALAVVAPGCSWFSRQREAAVNTNASAVSTPAVTSDTGPSAPPGEPRDAVIKASKKFLDLPQFTAELSGNGGSDMRMRLEYQAPDRFHVFDLGNREQGTSEFIIIGREMYMKVGDRWQKMPATTERSVPNLRNLFNEEGLKSLQDVKYNGPDTVDGMPMYVYSYRNSVTSANAPYPFTSKIWVGAADGLPHKIEVTYEQGQLRSMTVVYDLETPVSVEAPVKN